MTPEQELEYLSKADQRDIGNYLADRVRRQRRLMGLSQAEFAEKAGIAVRTFKRFELGGNGTINTLAKIMLAMGHARGFYTLFPQPKPSNRPSLSERVDAIGRIAVHRQSE